MSVITVLLVDDNVAMRRALERWLRLPPAFVVLGTNNLVGLQSYLENLTPDVVVTDMLLVGEDGFDVLRYMKAHYPQIPVILLTGVPELAATGAAGFARVLCKPTDGDSLRSTIQAVVKERRGPHE